MTENIMTLTLALNDGRTFTTTVGDGGDGAVRCGVDFNPTGNQEVDNIKGVSAGLMEIFGSLKDEAFKRTDNDGWRCFSTAMEHLESAQMFAVKGLFCGDKRKKVK